MDWDYLKRNTGMLESHVPERLYEFVFPPLNAVALSAVLVTHGQLLSEVVNEKSRNKQFTSFELCAFLSREMKSCTIPHCPSCPGRESSLRPGYPQDMLPTHSHSVAILLIRCTVLCASNPYLSQVATHSHRAA